MSISNVIHEYLSSSEIHGFTYFILEESAKTVWGFTLFLAVSVAMGQIAVNFDTWLNIQTKIIMENVQSPISEIQVSFNV